MAAQITTIPLSEIRARPQVRSEHNQGFKLYLNKDEKIHIDNSIISLAQSIRSRGLQNPIIVSKAHVDDDFNKPEIENSYIIVSGERRFRAAKVVAQWQQDEIEKGTFDFNEELVTSINCIIKDYNKESDFLIDQVTENIERSDLNAFEISDAISKFIEAYKKEHPDYLGKITRDIVSKAFNRSPNWVTVMTSFSELQQDNDQEIIEFFKYGTISSSPRCGYELLKIYKKNKQLVLNFLKNYKKNGKKVDRAAIPKLQKMLTASNEETNNLLISQLPGLKLSSTDEHTTDLKNTEKVINNSKNKKRLKIRCQYIDNNGLYHNFDCDFSEAYENDTQIKVTFEDGSDHVLNLNEILLISYA